MNELQPVKSDYNSKLRLLGCTGRVKEERDRVTTDSHRRQRRWQLAGGHQALQCWPCTADMTGVCCHTRMIYTGTASASHTRRHTRRPSCWTGIQTTQMTGVDQWSVWTDYELTLHGLLLIQAMMMMMMRAHRHLATQHHSLARQTRLTRKHILQEEAILCACSNYYTLRSPAVHISMTLIYELDFYFLEIY